MWCENNFPNNLVMSFEWTIDPFSEDGILNTTSPCVKNHGGLNSNMFYYKTKQKKTKHLAWCTKWYEMNQK